MILENDEIRAMFHRMESAQEKYGNFASAHEALGVALEEWNELQAAIHDNELFSIESEALDLAAVLLRLAIQCRTSDSLQKRSVK